MAITKNRMANQHDFSMIPRSDVPRSRFRMQQARKTTFNAGDLIPIQCEEMLPGDHFQGHTAIFARMATPIVPVLDNAEIETFSFFVPCRILWDNWEDFISGVFDYLIPQVALPVGGAAVGSLPDQFGLPVLGQIDPTANTAANALPFRAYNKIYNEWFRDQNLTTEAPEHTNDGPDDYADYPLRKRAKKKDYFTSCLPWPQKGTAVTLPLGNAAPVEPITYGTSAPVFADSSSQSLRLAATTASTAPRWDTAAGATSNVVWDITGLQANLNDATAATINSLREAFALQRMLEKDARGGSRYIEQILTHFGVRTPDFRLQRPEYIGGGKTTITTHPIAQTSESAATPQGHLAAFTQAHGSNHGFSYAATEHGYLITLANVRCDISYQQGTRRMWSKQTRYDLYWPTLSHLGEQAVMIPEIYDNGIDDRTGIVFGYQERHAEYRYTPNEICGLFRSTAAGSIDIWHYAQEFATEPTLNNAFITDASQDVLARSLAVGTEANGQQILLDCLHTITATRPMPTYSVPGLIDHF